MHLGRVKTTSKQLRAVVVGRESLGYSAAATPAKFIHTCSAFNRIVGCSPPAAVRCTGASSAQAGSRQGFVPRHQPGAAAVVVAGRCSQVQANLAGHLGHLLGDGLALARHKEPTAARRGCREREGVM